MDYRPRVEAFLREYPIRVVQTEPKGRLIALSDVHGCDDLFARVVEKLDLKPEDTLVIAGDLVERGKRSLKALRRAMALDERENTFVLIGNMDANKHWQIMSDARETDEGLLQNYRSFGASLFCDMCREIGLPLETAEDARNAKKAVRQAFGRELDFIRNRPTVLDTPVWRFVHGGLTTNDLSSLEGKPNCLLKYDNFVGLGPVMDKPLVVGHYPTNLYWEGPERVDPYWSAEKNVLSIDGGCGLRADAQLNAVILNPNIPGRFECVSADAFPRVYALDRQTYRAPTVRFRWPHNQAYIIERRPLSAIIRQLDTGAEAETPIAYIEGEKADGVYWINDLSDARLEILPGDEMTLFAVTETGAYVGRGNLRGWYYGRYETRKKED